MTEAEWLAAIKPSMMLRFLSVPGADDAVLAFSVEQVSRRKLRLFCVACCRNVWSRLVEPELRRSVELSEAFADDATVHTALLAASNVVYDIGDEEFSSGFVGGPTTPGLWERTAAVWEATKETVRPEGVAAKVALVVGEDYDDGPTSWANAALLRDIFGNPFRTVVLDPSWQTEAVIGLAEGIYQDHAFDRMPVLGDALEDAGCSHEDILNHCRQSGEHVRGCWVVDLLLGKT